MCTNLLVTAKKSGIDMDFPANKLIIGYGDYVCMFLCKVLEKFHKHKRVPFAKPVHYIGGDDMIEDFEDSDEEN